MNDLMVIFKNGEGEPYRLVSEREIVRVSRDLIEFEGSRWQRSEPWHAANIGAGEVMGAPQPLRERYDEI